MELRVFKRQRRQLQVSAGKSFADPDTEAFPAYELRFDASLLERSYGSAEPPCSWARDYENARKIFGETEQGRLCRHYLRMECQDLFTGPDGETHEVCGGDNLMRRIAYGTRCGAPQVFAYAVVSDGALRFCEAAAGVGHAAMASGAEEIWCAGEFWLMHQKGRYWLCVSNNSGTYRPSAEDLEKTVRLFQDIVREDFDVEGVLQSDPKATEYLAQGLFKGEGEARAVAPPAVQAPVPVPKMLPLAHPGAGLAAALATADRGMRATPQIQRDLARPTITVTPQPLTARLHPTAPALCPAGPAAIQGHRFTHARVRSAPGGPVQRV